MRKRRQIELFSISFLDLLSGALGAVIILYVAIPKNKPELKPTPEVVTEASKEEMARIQEENQKLKKQVSELTVLVDQREKEADVKSGKDVDFGFKFKGKEIVFIINTSYSMTEEDRMGQVKAGLKMLLFSMSPEFKIDIVQFPWADRAPFKSFWGRLNDVTAINKQDAVDHIYKLRPFGGTPSREALLFVLKNYETITDIVFLTDGVPTLHNSNKKDDIHDILRVVREANDRKVQINCIGVGSDFNRDKDNDRYKFMELLSQEHNGFFVGF